MPPQDDVTGAGSDELGELDPYACDACVQAEDICLFHRGFATGWDACVAVLARCHSDDAFGDAA
jgi:hypothetical protein